MLSIPFSSAEHSQFWQSEGSALAATRLEKTLTNFLAVFEPGTSSLLAENNVPWKKIILIKYLCKSFIQKRLKINNNKLPTVIVSYLRST